MFKPDLFSKSIPNWKEINIHQFKNHELLIREVFGDTPLSQIKIQSSGALEINSSNFLISKGNKTVLIKRWSNQTSIREIDTIINILLFLDKEGVLIAKPLKFRNHNYILKIVSGIYTLNEYIDGEYFSGEKEQLKNAAYSIAQLSNVLLKLPLNQYPKSGPNCDYHKIKAIIDKTEKNRNHWDILFGMKNAKILRSFWGNIEKSLDEMNNFDQNYSKKHPIHFDLHPHNILFKNNKLCAFLDYDSIKTMNVGQALSFSALKLCRQSVCISSPQYPKKLSAIFIQELSQNLEGDKSWLDNIYFLAISEVLRRISIIFDLNFKNQKQWNKVLHIQVNHLLEAKLLFN